MSETMPQPIRESVRAIQCRCVVIAPNGSEDRCEQQSSDPDSPLCTDCRWAHFEGYGLDAGQSFRMVLS